jgi:hypothetical protein
VNDSAASMALAQLTGLQSLKVYHAPQMSDQGLLAMSALRRLTELNAWDCGICDRVADCFDDDSSICLESLVSSWILASATQQ